MKKSEKKNSQNMLILGAVALIAVGGAVFYLSAQGSENDAASDVVVDATPPTDLIRTEQEAARQREILEGFETSLNNFLTNIDQQVSAYQARRNTVRDMIKPENMRYFEYVPENYGIAKEVMGQMEADMEAIIGFISKSDVNIQNYLERENPSNRNELLQKWNDVKAEQSTLYISFFDLERELLLQYDRIFTIFLKSRGHYAFDEATNNVTFKDEAIATEYMTVKQRIDSIIAEEKSLLSETQQNMGQGSPSSSLSPEMTNQALETNETLPNANVQPQTVTPVVLPNELESNSVGQPIMPVDQQNGGAANEPAPDGVNDAQDGANAQGEGQAPTPYTDTPPAVPMTSMPATNEGQDQGAAAQPAPTQPAASE